jgi:hypothetical protein
MPETHWNKLVLLTIRLEKLCSDRTIAHCMGDEKLRDHFQTQIDDLLEHRKRLIDPL